jgi:hypothetical protein
MSDEGSDPGKIRVGIGGWVFPPWRGTFYPKTVKQADELAHASRHVTAIEINGTFYRLQTPASYKRWHDETPDDFVFSLKGSRFITHRNDLSTAAPFMERFFASGMEELGPKLGPILWQFMPAPMLGRRTHRLLPRSPRGHRRTLPGPRQSRPRLLHLFHQRRQSPRSPRRHGADPRAFKPLILPASSCYVYA